MLQSLFIENFVLIDHLEIDFHPKMTVFTGETGAGKSIIMGALSLALGNRADTQSIGPFSDQTEIIATFNVANNLAAKKWLQEQELNQQDELIIRRTINQQGRSKQWVNGRPTPSGLVKELNQHLVQIHGQHDQVKLLKNQHQLTILDQAGSHELLLKQTAESLNQLKTVEQDIDNLLEAGSLGTEQLQLLQYQFDELQQLSLTEGEYETLHAELQTAAHAQDLLQAIDGSVLTLNDPEQGVEHQLTQIINTLGQAKGHDFGSICQMLDESLININEAQQQLGSLAEGIDSNPEHLASIEGRLEQISHVARKQNVMPELLFQHSQDLAQTLNQHANLSAEQQQLEHQRTESLAAYRQAAVKLHQQRKQAAKNLATTITQTIQQLGLPEAQFSVEVTHDEAATPKSLGNDLVTFMIAANKGQKSQPLSKTASGGELSRISLAIEVSTQQKNQHQAFVFDEVDTGIGGGTAEQVGHIMQQLSANNQVFAVTHLPQVAGHAHDHLLVSKSSQGQHTTSSVKHLDETARIEELARMSGGQTITEATLAQAKEFLKTGS